MVALTTYRAEGTRFRLLDPDESTLRDTLPGQAYEPVVTALLSGLVREDGAVVADIGALYGYFAVWAAKHAPAAQVYAFEPERSYTEVVEHNARLNGCANLSVETLALTDGDGPFQFATKTLLGDQEAVRRPYLRGIGNGIGRLRAAPTGEWVTATDTGPVVSLREFAVAEAKHRLRVKLQRRAVDSSHEVIGKTLDTWSAERDVFPTVLKIDVHGAEGMVLAGAKSVLRSSVRHVLLELHTRDLLLKYDHEDVLSMLEDAGFEVFAVEGFRHDVGRLVPLVGAARRQFVDQRQWTATELYFMRFLYARRAG